MLAASFGTGQGRGRIADRGHRAGAFRHHGRKLLRDFGLTPDRVAELARQALTWALPNLMLGALVIVPVWFVVFLFRPPRRAAAT